MRRGFVLIWVTAAVLIVSTMALGILAAVRAGVQRAEETEIRTDMVLLAQDMTEKEKSRLRFGTAGAETGTIDRNGRRYERTLRETDTAVNGVPMKDVRCTVRAENGMSFETETMVDL